MKRWNKLAAIVMSSVLAAGALAGCGSSSSDSSTDAESTSSAGSQSTEAAAASEDYSEDLPSDYTGTLSMWGWDDTYFKTMTEAFQKKYPNVTFNYTPMANGDSLQKYQTALAAGTELPDVAWAIIDSRAKVYELDMWEDLSQAPYNFSLNEVDASVRERLVNQEGKVCGIEQCLCPTGLAYRKDLAKEYLGTDDPAELEAMLPDWETFIEKGKEIYEKSGGTVYMLPSVSEAQQIIRQQTPDAWINGDTIEVTKTLKRSIDLAVEMRDNNTCDKLDAWSTAWYAAFGEDTHIFTGCATWSIPFNIEPNDPEGETTGHWGLMDAPEGGIIWGGTAMGITKTCKDKRLAWEFLKFATLSTEGAQAAKNIAFFTSAVKPYEEDPDLKNYKSAWFGDQNLGEKFLDDILPNTAARPMSVDDNTIHDALNTINTEIMADTSLTADQALDNLKEELSEQLPSYNIE